MPCICSCLSSHYCNRERRNKRFFYWRHNSWLVDFSSAVSLSCLLAPAMLQHVAWQNNANPVALCFLIIWKNLLLYIYTYNLFRKMCVLFKLLFGRIFCNNTICCLTCVFLRSFWVINMNSLILYNLLWNKRIFAFLILFTYLRIYVLKWVLTCDG